MMAERTAASMDGLRAGCLDSSMAVWSVDEEVVPLVDWKVVKMVVSMVE